MSIFSAMSIPDLYLNRNAPIPDVYTYDLFPTELKVKIIAIWKKFFYGNKSLPFDQKGVEQIFYEIAETFASEIGLHTLILYQGFPTKAVGSFASITHFFENVTTDIPVILSLIELVFRRMLDVCDNYSSDLEQYPLSYGPDEAILELNSRFRMGGVGYRFESRQIIKISHDLLHSEVMIPTLVFLSKKAYAGANAEFLKAHRHFREGDTTSSINEAFKALESTIKIVLAQRQWECPKGSTLITLINKLKTKRFFDDYIGVQFDTIILLLKKIGDVRNEEAGHGQGVEKKEISTALTSFALYNTASAIKFLVETNGY